MSQSGLLDISLKEAAAIETAIDNGHLLWSFVPDVLDKARNDVVDPLRLSTAESVSVISTLRYGVEAGRTGEYADAIGPDICADDEHISAELWAAESHAVAAAAFMKKREFFATDQSWEHDPLQWLRHFEFSAGKFQRALHAARDAPLLEASLRATVIAGLHDSSSGLDQTGELIVAEIPVDGTMLRAMRRLIMLQTLLCFSSRNRFGDWGFMPSVNALLQHQTLLEKRKPQTNGECVGNVSDVHRIQFEQDELISTVRRSEMEDFGTEVAKLLKDVSRETKMSVTECENIKEGPLSNSVQLWLGDCVDAAHFALLNSTGKVVLLNMANDHEPGGGYLGGAGAQEENLHRRSNLFMHLGDPDGCWPDRPWRYPLPEFGGVFSPRVIFFRSSEERGYEFINPFELDVITLAAYRRPRTVRLGSKLCFADDVSERVQAKIWCMFEMARRHGCSSIVLSAFGCGAFRNPPHEIARCFNDVIRRHRYDKLFQRIIFSIYDDHNAGRTHNPDGNWQPFVDVFGADRIISHQT